MLTVKEMLEPMARVRRVWRNQLTPLGTVPPPARLPKIVRRPSGNPAARWLHRRGWWSLRQMALVFKVSRDSLRDRLRRGEVRYIQVGGVCRLVPPEEVYRLFLLLADTATIAAWRAAGGPILARPNSQKPWGPPVGEGYRRVKMGRPEFEVVIYSRGFTLASLARASGLSVKGIYRCRWKTWKVGPQQETIEALSRTLQLPQTEIRRLLAITPRQVNDPVLLR